MGPAVDALHALRTEWGEEGGRTKGAERLACTVRVVVEALREGLPEDVEVQVFVREILGAYGRDIGVGELELVFGEVYAALPLAKRASKVHVLVCMKYIFADLPPVPADHVTQLDGLIGRLAECALVADEAATADGPTVALFRVHAERLLGLCSQLLEAYGDNKPSSTAIGCVTATSAQFLAATQTPWHATSLHNAATVCMQSLSQRLGRPGDEKPVEYLVSYYLGLLFACLRPVLVDWKTHPLAMPVLSFCLDNLKPNMVNKNDSQLGLAVSACLRMVDDYEETNKATGLRHLAHLIGCLPREFWFSSGLIHVVSKTMEREIGQRDPTIVSSLLCAYAILLPVIDPNPSLNLNPDAAANGSSYHGFGVSDHVMQQLMREWRYEDKLKVRKAYAEGMPPIIAHTGLLTTRHLKALVETLCEYFDPVVEDSVLPAIDCLFKVVQVAWPRLGGYSARLVAGLGSLHSNMHHISSSKLRKETETRTANLLRLLRAISPQRFETALKSEGLSSDFCKVARQAVALAAATGC